MKKLEKMLWEGVDENNLRKVALALNLGANVDAKGWNDQTPLHWAVRGVNIALAKLLIDSGANVNAKDKNGDTPLHRAIGRNIAIAKLLIASGADVNAKNNKGNTLLDWTQSQKMKALLKQHGAI